MLKHKDILRGLLTPWYCDRPDAGGEDNLQISEGNRENTEYN